MVKAPPKVNKIRDTEARQILARLKNIAIHSETIAHAIQEDDYLTLKMAVRDLGYVVFGVIGAFDRIPYPGRVYGSDDE